MSISDFNRDFVDVIDRHVKTWETIIKNAEEARESAIAFRNEHAKKPFHERAVIFLSTVDVETNDMQHFDANLSIELGQEAIKWGQSLRKLLPDSNHADNDWQVKLYNELKQQLNTLETLNSEHMEILKKSTLSMKTESREIINLRWIRSKIVLVKELLQMMPADVIARANEDAEANVRERNPKNDDFGTELQAMGGRRRTGRKRSGKKCKRTICKKRKCLTRRRLRRR